MAATVTQEQVEILVDAYVRTNNVAASATEAGISRTLAYYYLEQRGFNFERDVPLVELAERRAEGMTYEMLSEHFGVSLGTIHNWLSQLQMAGTRSRTMGNEPKTEPTGQYFE